MVLGSAGSLSFYHFLHNYLEMKYNVTMTKYNGFEPPLISLAVLHLTAVDVKPFVYNIKLNRWSIFVSYLRCKETQKLRHR